MKGKPNSCRGVRWSLQGSEWKSNSKHVDDMARLWRLKLESKETPTLVTKATGRRRDIGETLMQHDVRASREAAGTSSSQKGTWLYRRQPEPKTLRACQNTSWTAEELTGRTNVLRCEAIADQADTQKVRESHTALSDACWR